MGNDGGSADGWPGQGHILVVDDERVVRELLRKMLEREGYHVHEAPDGSKAVDVAKSSKIDLAIIDLWMPEMNGVEVIEALRAMEHPAEVVVLSSHVTEASTNKLRGLGVSRILTKPIQREALLDAVKSGGRADAGGVAGESAAKATEEARAETVRAQVLVADDDRQVRSLLRTLLSGAGYIVVEAGNGSEAVEKVLAYDIDLVITDLNMPEMSGREAIETLHRATRDTFIICVTGEATQQEIDAAIRAGALKCFRKPFDSKALLAEIERLDLIATHRKRLVERERAQALKPLERRDGGRRKWMLVAAVVIVVMAAIAVPIISAFLSAAADAASSAAEQVKEATDAAGRIEGYLERDEQRELQPRR